MLAAIIFNWAVGIRPPELSPDIKVSVKRLDQERFEVMIIFIGKDTAIKYLSYGTPQGRSIINKSSNTPEPVRDAGEAGIIQDLSGRIEIFATLDDGKTIRIYDEFLD